MKQFRPALHAEFGVDSRKHVFHRLFGDAECRCQFFVGVAFEQSGDQFAFAWGQGEAD